jgi:chromosome condensin MukBEF MukE localization factor
MFELVMNEKIFYSKSGKPKSVLLDYKVFKEMIKLIEDSECIKIIESRKTETEISEEELLKKIKIS